MASPGAEVTPRSSQKKMTACQDPSSLLWHCMTLLGILAHRISHSFLSHLGSNICNALGMVLHTCISRVNMSTAMLRESESLVNTSKLLFLIFELHHSIQISVFYRLSPLWAVLFCPVGLLSPGPLHP